MTERIRSINFGKLTEEQKLATETCPGFSAAVDRALRNSWEVEECRECRGYKAVAVKFIPYIDELQVWGSCPKL